MAKTRTRQNQKLKALGTERVLALKKTKPLQGKTLINLQNYYYVQKISSTSLLEHLFLKEQETPAYTKDVISSLSSKFYKVFSCSNHDHQLKTLLI